MKNISILVVEDEAITAMDIRSQLQHLGYVVPKIIDTGEEAVQLTKDLHPDLVLMDILLKGQMDGIQAAEEIAKYNVPIIFITAFKDKDSFDRAKICNPYNYITKPFDYRDLHNAIELSLLLHYKDMLMKAQFLQEKNEALESASLEKDKFLATLSHELRTPLNAIVGFTGTLLMKLAGPLNEAQEKQLTIMKASADHLLSLINDLLNIAKVESGTIEVHVQKINVKDVIKEILFSLSPLADLKNLKLSFVDSGGNDTLLTDKKIFSQVLINMINNAIKFTKEGEIKVFLDKKMVEDKKYIVVHVVDTGIGIKLEDQKKLFYAFYRVNSHDEIEGTGLGLHLSKKLVERLNGKIELISEPGKGSDFSILFPEEVNG